MSKLDNEKILVVSPADSFFTAPHVRAFERAGYKCKTFNNRRGLVYSSSLLKRISRGVPGLRFIKDLTLKNTNQKLISVI